MSFHRRRFLQYSAGSALGTIALGWLAGCTPESSSTAGTDTPPSDGGVVATDEGGTPYAPETVLAAATAGDRILAQGLENPAFLVITDGPAFADYGISSVCPHRQCVVDWDPAAELFICPCHDSRFDAEGKVTQGPATTHLETVAVTADGEQVLLSN
ncbi:Rieske 2Fe-2S domain-containing protein [Leptolyngbya sp. PCC 6406]|uniref:Rieske 2Fe-2S domain-containing protein n=1 Tax=Leptolyngbya sp. PCC 6406 TaxID=1173264 RepID=UPI0002ABCDDC|nr:Rieske 2Fe-2S domain-containing protein [Leptolyngbya sp. PCC 6406]